MTGRNKIVLNQASVNEALEEYLKKRMPVTPLKVEEVSYGRGDEGFEIVFMIDEEKKM